MMLAREAVDASIPAGVRGRLDGALGSLFWWREFLPTAGDLELDDFEVPSNLSHDVDDTILLL